MHEISESWCKDAKNTCKQAAKQMYCRAMKSPWTSHRPIVLLRGLKEPNWNVSKNLKGNKFKVATDHKKTKGHELTDLQVSNSCPQGLLLDAFPTHRSELT